MAAGSAKKKKQHGEDNKAPAQDGDNNSSTKLYIEVQDEADEETEDKKASDLAISLDRANSIAENLKKLIKERKKELIEMKAKAATKSQGEGEEKTHEHEDNNEITLKNDNDRLKDTRSKAQPAADKVSIEIVSLMECVASYSRLLRVD